MKHLYILLILLVGCGQETSQKLNVQINKGELGLPSMVRVYFDTIGGTHAMHETVTKVDDTTYTTNGIIYPYKRGTLGNVELYDFDGRLLRTYAEWYKKTTLEYQDEVTITLIYNPLTNPSN